ncbi:MAG: lytic transglycosylase domain-containing protein [Paracoccaceae bacterium]
MKRRLFVLSLLIYTQLPGAVYADEPAPFPDFTFRRVTVPGAGTGDLITIQIDPSQKPPPPVPALPQTPKPSVTEYSWFWDHVSPKLEDASGGRLERAVNHLTNEGQKNGLQGPRLQFMQSLAQKFGNDILLATIGTDVSPALVLAVMGVESSGNIDALSSAGAQGLMQLMPATAERFGVTNTGDAADNIRGGVAYLNWLMHEFNNDPVFVLAAYNAGENAVKSRGGVPDFPETRAYVPKVLAAWTVARALCQTTPELASDGCVFAIQEARN